MTNKDNQLVTRQEHIMAQFPDVFEGIGNSQANLTKSASIPRFLPSKHLAGLSQYT